MTMQEYSFDKENEPNLYCTFSEEGVFIYFFERAVRHTYDYKIADPEDHNETHQMRMAENADDPDWYDVAITRKIDDQPIMEFRVREQEGKTIVRDFYESFCAGFVLGLVQQETKHMQAFKAIFKDGINPG